MKRKFPGSITVGDLIKELSKFDPEAVVLVSSDTEGNSIVDVDEVIGLGYRTGEGEVLFEESVQNGEDVSGYDDVVVLWPVI